MIKCSSAFATAQLNSSAMDSPATKASAAHLRNSCFVIPTQSCCCDKSSLKSNKRLQQDTFSTASSFAQSNKATSPTLSSDARSLETKDSLAAMILGAILALLASLIWDTVMRFSVCSDQSSGSVMGRSESCCTAIVSDAEDEAIPPLEHTRKKRQSSGSDTDEDDDVTTDSTFFSDSDVID
jgi:sensor c-di-GMP phosphodiesterase-like protein